MPGKGTAATQNSPYSTNGENRQAIADHPKSAISLALSTTEAVPNVGVPFSPWLPAIHPFLQFTAPLPPPFPSLHLPSLFPSGGGINYTVARDRTRPFKFRLFPADAEIELGIGAARSGVQTMKERKAHSHK